MYDTDEQVAAKLNSLQKKIRGKTKEKTKVLYPITPLQTALNPPKQGNFMIMVPSSNTAGGVTPVNQTGTTLSSKPADTQIGMLPLIQAGQSLVPMVTSVHNTNQPHPAWSKEALVKSTEAKSSLVSLLNRAPKSITSATQTGTSTTESPKQTSRQPNILRAKSHKNVPPPDSEPTPMQLFRSYKAGNEPENADINSFASNEDDNAETPLNVIIKQEPMEYNSDNTEDDTSKRTHGEPPDKFKHVLNTDAQMPVDNENDLNMELVIKTEPIDDFIT